MHEEIVYFPRAESREAFQIQMCGRSYCDGSYRICRDHSSIWCIEYIYEGEGYVEVDDIKFKASAGDIYLLPKGKKHYYYSDEKNPWKKIWFNIHGDFVEGTLQAYGLERVYHVKSLNLQKEFELFVETAEHNLKNEDMKSAFAKCAVLFLQIVQKISEVPRQQEKHGPPSKVELLKTKIDGLTNFSQSFDDILEEFFYTKSYIIRAFKEAYGITPYNYLLEHKMHTAKSLLRNTAMSISELSIYLGFANAHYFSNFFSKREGVSPKEYRMSLVTQEKKE